MEKKERIAIALDWLKANQGLTQRKVAEKLKVSQGTISQLRNGEIELTERMANSWGIILGISGEWLQNETGDMLLREEGVNQKPQLPLTEQHKEQILNDILLSRKIVNNPTLRAIAEMLVNISLDEQKKIKAIIETFLK
ncbi:DNA-binding helix-turn-helix protein [Leptospira kirschneri]|uniref:helix-turn-helix domain-containing protein n=1 Tax=Leptospira kirschneri TaxID=29507 RepID=UPI0002BD548A|nr:helix-turn-helix transcriptional regulator [Leptospira kirschneri]EMK02967.1 DNA-binding helix-turn-helix protein [Leptospira kirschneri]